MIPYKQLSMEEIFTDCQNKFENDKPAFLSLLEEHIDLDEIIPITFHNHFYASTGRTRKYPLNAMLWALIIQRIFSIPTDQLPLTFLHYSKPLREFCGFNTKFLMPPKSLASSRIFSRIYGLFSIAFWISLNQSAKL